MNYKHRKIIEVAQQFGYLTAKEFANFLKIYNPKVKINNNGRELVYLSLF